MDNISEHTKQRIGYLHNPQAVDELLDLFQHMGIPMGSDTWAEQAICIIKRMESAEITLNRIEAAIKDIEQRDYRDVWRAKYQQFADQSVARIREREDKAEAEYLASHPSSGAEVSSPSLAGKV